MTGEQLKHIRESKGLSQSDFGALFDTSAGNVSRWEKGIHEVPSWVEKELFRTVKIPLPIEDLHALVEHARRENQPLETILAEAIRAYLGPKPGNIIRYDPGSETEPKVAEPPPE
jgi:transcriptional regulator with XRE-family HTH domain